MSSKEYVKDLKRESLSNQTINDQFRFIADAYLLYSFFESKPMQGLGFVVDKDSACIGKKWLYIPNCLETNRARWTKA